MRLALTTALASLVMLSACGVKETEPEGSEGSAEQQDMTPEGPSITSRLFGGGEPMGLDIQLTHPNRSVVQLTSMQAKPSETVVTAVITNGAEKEMYFNRYGNDDTYIVTGSGQKLYLSPPAGNEKLGVTAGQRVQVELVFLGNLPEGESATLIFNDGEATDNRFSDRPGFRIPLPLTEAAFSDDGSKKN
ncbi:hypothetical protein [Qipengyuania qiaonensis]|uniref:Copper chaperone PCu(A)C n=1 Tax=Qipengyuania qiaonensis TaxID=2867240 RepID=A0ABS7J4L3_9SPHN|nr:hypothetical protein [Qipengyuania qiaonensis]MBX7482275.1 hypothetical protein [Qipengyuania qiaonensis]